MWVRLAERLLQREAAAFTPALYALHRQRVAVNLQISGVISILLLLVTLAATVPLLTWGVGNPVMASTLTAALLFVLLSTILGSRDVRQARLLPYFERPLGDIQTWLAGRALLWNSCTLDAIARDLEQTPLTAFVSGDPLIVEETPLLFPPDQALSTVTALLSSPAVAALGADVVDDLAKLQQALRRAAGEGTQFSLHLREGNSASGYEMERRQGSYF